MAEARPWENLFEPVSPGDSGRAVRMRLLCRHGQPFLLLPNSPALAAPGLELYGPQTRAARWAKRALSLGLRCGLTTIFKGVTLNFNEKDPFVVFLREQSGSEHFAVLAGNPNTRGQRFLFLLFDPAGNPAVIVKAGAGLDASALIAHEEAFLKNAPDLPGIPELRAVYDSERARALAMDFFAGDIPSSQESESALKLLTAWLRSGSAVSLGKLAVWQRLMAATEAEVPGVVQELSDIMVSPALYHGDFAPWNIRVKDGQWIVVDWERGDPAGPPLWDWLHFVIQPAILVEHSTPDAIVQRLNSGFRSPRFGDYADQARIRGLEWRLVQAYLHYCIQVVRQTEGLDQVRELAKRVALREKTA